MPNPSIDPGLLVEALQLFEKHGVKTEASKYATRMDGGIGISHATFTSRLKLAMAAQAAGEITAGGIAGRKATRTPAEAHAQLRAALLARPATLSDLAKRLDLEPRFIEESLEALSYEGYNVRRRGDVVAIDKDVQLPSLTSRDDLPTYYSRPDNTYVFGATSDNHLGSKYARLDVLNELYDRFAEAEVDRVYNAGNWIDGEARFNKFDLEVHGMDAQCRYLAEHYPQRDGITTYAVSGDDHEGWYTQREGVNIGKYAQRAMREAGREDWVDLGYMEAFIRLINSNTGAECIMAVVHPGGGSAYALSYSIQKIIESLDGGEKPAVGLYGHYHKLWAGNIRNVWCIQTGCTEDQTPFMRKNKLEAHVGGVLVALEQDPVSGAIMACTPKIMRWFNRGFTNGRWSHSDPVKAGKRTRV